MVRRITLVLALFCTIADSAGGQAPASLRGSPTSVARMKSEALRHDFTFLETPAQVERFDSLGLLVRLRGNTNYSVDDDVKFPVVRPETKLFVERISRQHRAECGQKLVVTSGTRPHSDQPRNASVNSVHPTGMAVDFRPPPGTVCRRWLDGVLLYLEGCRVLEATREVNPPHYHIAVYARQYKAYVAGTRQC